MKKLPLRNLLYRSGLSFFGSFPIPACLLRHAIRLSLAVVAGKEPKRAMVAFLQIEDDLTAMINRMAIFYDEGIHVKHRLMKYHEFFIQRVKTGERVLDIGCGNGALSFDLAECAGAIVKGIDIEKKNIDLAREKFQHKNLCFIAGDATHIISDEHFDVIVLSNVLEHIQDRIGFLQDVNHRMKPDRFLVRIPMIDRDWRVPLRKELGLPYFSDATHFTEYSEKSFVQELAAAGLNLKHYQINWGEIWAEAKVGG